VGAAGGLRCGRGASSADPAPAARGRLLAAAPATALAAALAVATAPAALADNAPASAQTRAVRDLWEKVKHNCATESVRYLVDSVGHSSRDTLVSDALRSLQKAKIDAALDALFLNELSGVRRDFTPEERAAIYRYMDGDAATASGLIRPYLATYLRVSAELIPTAAGSYQLTLAAEGLAQPGGGGGCSATSDPVDLPKDEVDDPIVPLADVVLRAVRRLQDQARGEVVIRTSAEVIGEGSAPAGWTRYLTGKLQEALTAEADARLSGAVIRIRTESEVAGMRGEIWRAEIQVRRSPDTYEIVISVLPANASDFATRGRVLLAELPPVAAVDLPQRPIEDPPPTGTAPAIGRFLAVTLQAQRFTGELPGEGATEDYLFEIAEPHVVEFDARAEDPSAPPPVLALHAADGAAVAETMPPARAPTTHRYRLEPGRYRLRLANPGPASLPYVLVVRGGPDALPVLLPANAALLGEVADWRFGRAADAEGRPACFAATVATAWRPAGWRPIRPYLWFLVEEGERPDNYLRLEQQLDVPAYYDPERPVTATASAASWRRTMTLTPAHGQFRSLVPGTTRVDLGFIEGLTEGASLALDGTTRDGRPARVTFSLRGYQAAINAMLTLCRREDLRRDLIRR
jgi:hypothetical protein